MPFIDANDGARRWVSTRDTIWLQDTLRRASETLARDVETFLFDDNDPKHRDVAFLMWAVARYDIAKTGSGRYADTVDYDPSEALKDPFGDDTRRTKTPGQRSEIDVRLPAHAREKLGDEFTAPDHDPEVPHYSRPDLPSGVTDGRSKHNLTPPPPGQVPLVNADGDPAGLAQAPRYDGPVRDSDPLDQKEHEHEDDQNDRSSDDGMPTVHKDDRIGEEFSTPALDNDAKPLDDTDSTPFDDPKDGDA